MSVIRVIFITIALAVVLGLLIAGISLTGVWPGVLDALRDLVAFAKAFDALLQTSTALPLLTFNVVAWGAGFFACVVLKTTQSLTGTNSGSS